jgi:isopenicillin N synthase-like dioxygenase
MPTCSPLTPPSIIPKFHIPTIDISSYLVSPSVTSPSFLKILDTVRLACETTGFFQIIGHGIPRELQNEVFAASKRFFDLSMEEKKV